MAQGWSLLRRGLVIEPEIPVNLYLGCTHIRGTRALSNCVCATTLTYVMEQFLASCVELYLKFSFAGDAFAQSWDSVSY